MRDTLFVKLGFRIRLGEGIIRASKWSSKIGVTQSIKSRGDPESRASSLTGEKNNLDIVEELVETFEL